MARGGKRPGSGRPKGSGGGPTEPTREKAAVEQEYRKFMLRQAGPLWLGQLERARGVYVLMVQTKAGPVRVTDPERIARVMATPATPGEGYWWIEAEKPDAAFAKEINNRLMGVPAQPHEVTATHTLAEILAGLTPKDEER